MDLDKYIASGILELYVAGQLSERENREIAALAEAHPRVREEIEAIEATVRGLSSAYAAGRKPDFAPLQSRLAKPSRVRPLWPAYSGWAAAVVVGAASVYFYVQNRDLQSQLQRQELMRGALEEQIANTEDSLKEANRLLEALGERSIQVVPLQGQTVAPEAYARAYWNREDTRLYIDARGLPEPPPGMVYQVWSLTLDPLTPVSLGLLEDFAADADKIFALQNPNASEAFGITLEPAGGSATPTLEQLYTLGTVPS
ncbi:anti-sigma factor [Robiginitalea sp. M366]|uniref:anti-sigma factor n=1 Tax=Robiginitalea aestuariiviva TaxID=3036903 RepID=UPI00240D5872|nr:anti-sigma factor [Robiginitalea aestuariiviva]MDG1572645.1 anti-sigma factor [Robiginitalea aestuariiviva]